VVLWFVLALAGALAAAARPRGRADGPDRGALAAGPVAQLAGPVLTLLLVASV
jgi:hypothetical protein